ncbi:EAL domain-containing protein [Undibacterium sp. Dicai25W]|uniref:EAL domain-containing protein n=1 Tax=Undibacterium sp. Dicai25W TaxID=3413034 RepID=UPI003BF085C7
MPNFLKDLLSTFKLRRIGVRLVLSYGILLTLFIVVLILPLGQINKMMRLEDKFAHEDMRKLLVVQELGLLTESVSNALPLLLTAARDKREQQYGLVDEKNKKITSLIATLERTLDDPSQQNNLKLLKQRRDAYQKMYLDLVNLLEDEGQEAATKNFYTEVEPSLNALLAISSRLLQNEQDLIIEHQNQSQQDLKKTGIIAILLSILAVIVAALLAWITTRSVVRPLEQLQTRALKIAAGDYQTQIPVSNTEEIAKVGLALNTMSNAIASREKDIEHLAFFDGLTGLPNRTYLLKTMGQANLNEYTIILMDLARLKSVNETLGFDTGDSVILHVAQRIQHVIATSHIDSVPLLVKLAGGSFAVMIPSKNQTTIEDIYLRIDQANNEPVKCENYAVDVDLVYGFALQAEVPLPLIHLLRNAEVALYAAKRSSKKLAWYSDAQEASRLSHLSLLSDLRTAVKSNELQMWLQPKIKLSTAQVYGFEALVRWQHPARGFISPAEFVPFAESTGYIGIITDWMLESAVIKLAEWKNIHPDLSIAVNVSTHDLRDKNFPDRVASLLKQYNVDPHHLRIEITESGIMEDPDSAIELLHRLRQTGISLSIDDFGTGYSSLAYLQKLPVNELKIDRSFVTNIDQLSDTQRLVKTIIELGHGLKLSVIAEGIETEQERAILQQLGCDCMQGYLVSKPLYGKQLQDWLDKSLQIDII